MLLALVTNTFICFSYACYPTWPTPPAAPIGCPPLYDTSLCPAGLDCVAENGITYDGQTAIINCPDNFLLRIRYSDGTIEQAIPVDQFKAMFRIVCVNGRWGVFEGENPTGEEIQGLACYQAAERLRIRSPLLCKRCTAKIKGPAGDNVCPNGYRCFAPAIITKQHSNGCKHLTVDCGGSDLLIQLTSGQSMLAHSEDVTCDGEWSIKVGHYTHRIDVMLCLSKIE
ncbi:unnamed protein product [Cylicocyclus nassatus]|uniref:Uncharacterized protein n=1 Tax=Cylicocyclus nassatus TaxID=53992 RepID=A0AA36DP86_CYLNA|nr:unnamed protein product [Cylicocyclus nassatus]